jgi:hypothetical protein
MPAQNQKQRGETTMKTQFSTLLLGITIGASLATLIAEAERRRLQAALDDAQQLSGERAIVSPDIDTRSAQGRLMQRSRWEREALGLPLDDEDYDDDDDE